MDWLNERTDEKIKLFGLEIELWRIGDSLTAPKFNIISQPNDWSRTVQKAAGGSGEVSEHKQLQLRFWTGFKEYMESKNSFVRCQKPLPQHWTNHAIGRSGIHLGSIISSWSSETNRKGPEIRVELYMDGPNAKGEFAALQEQKDTIEKSLGFRLGLVEGMRFPAFVMGQTNPILGLVMCKLIVFGIAGTALPLGRKLTL